MDNNYILFQAYGSRQILAECRFALMQLLRYNNPGDFIITIYTDDETYLQNELSLFPHKIIRKVSAGDIAQWKGAINFVHRVKIKILQDFFNTHSGNIIYFDTDTCCRQSLQPLFSGLAKGSFFMHINEGQVCQPKTIGEKKWFRFLKATKRFVHNAGLENPEAIYMMNAGVIGINSADAPLLEKVVAVTDSIYPVFPRHNVEQFAFSYVLQRNGKVTTTDKEIFHYWDLKEYRVFLEHFFSTATELPVEKQAAILNRFHPEPLMAEKFYRKKTFFLLKPFKKKWDINDFTNQAYKMIEETR